jgi:transcriptional regulator with XRE-family HTH domain
MRCEYHVSKQHCINATSKTCCNAWHMCQLLGCNGLQYKTLDKSCKTLQIIRMNEMNELKGTSENACVMFGEFVKSTRLRSKIIARDAAANAGMLPSNFSKIEHGALAPPQDAEKQKKLASAIGIKLNSDLAAKFFDLAGKASRTVPVDLAEIISREEALPLLLRTIGNKRLGQKEIERLISIVRETHEQVENTEAHPSRPRENSAKLSSTARRGRI